MMMAPTPPAKLDNFFDYISGGNLFGVPAGTPAAATPAAPMGGKGKKDKKGGMAPPTSPTKVLLPPGAF